MPDPIITCTDCLKRTEGHTEKQLRLEYRIGPRIMAGRWKGQGHAMYLYKGSHALVSLCMAPRRVGKE